MVIEIVSVIAALVMLWVSENTRTRRRRKSRRRRKAKSGAPYGLAHATRLTSAPATSEPPATKTPEIPVPRFSPDGSAVPQDGQAWKADPDICI